MGLCFSHDNYVCVKDVVDFSACSAPTARVISSSGVLHEYALPVTVSKVLEAEISAASSSSRSLALFLCDSDELNYEELIPEMGPEEPLAKGQIYFALPRSRLARPLSASDMAALAVKASLALPKDGSSKGRGRRSQISPVLESSSGVAGAPKGLKPKSSEKPLLLLPMPPPLVGKYRRSPSNKGFKIKGVRSFRIRLSTIQEGCESVQLDQCCRF
ncbi:hypothetical protein SAY87_010732 [Trapa incisa]|uniref:Uncharacterized protein n=1 Tax=Trapa incisa TaxID=236973 RepID=A0AAN7GJZ8_9MYRT|nr:hypothetical protein SAY87_010732 [Trapa incisa]